MLAVATTASVLLPAVMPAAATTAAAVSASATSPRRSSADSLTGMVARRNHIKPATAGGVMILAETFDHSIFRQSLARMFATGPDGLLEQGYNATLEVALPKVPVVPWLQHPVHEQLGHFLDLQMLQ